GVPGGGGVPVLVGGVPNAVAVAGGGFHSMALQLDGSVYAWGRNDHGQVGDGSTTNRTTPVPVGGLSGVVALGAGESHSFAIKADGTVMAWGWNYMGKLGDGTTTER